jgi:signal transduction histidine kinase
LVSNAVKYTPGGLVEVAVLDEGSDRVRVTVRDHGPGIPAEAKGRLFDRYFRSGFEEGSDRAGDGLGLGLYISRVIARAHGGDLTVADAPGGGALFTLVLPRRQELTAAGGPALVTAGA